MFKELIKTALKSNFVGKMFYPIAQMIYRSIAIPIKQRRLQKYGIEVLQDITRIFEDNNILYCLDWGTLLGIIRENGFIKHDDDIDITVLDKNITPEQLLKILMEKGCKFIHAIIINDRISEFSVF